MAVLLAKCPSCGERRVRAGTARGEHRRRIVRHDDAAIAADGDDTSCGAALGEFLLEGLYAHKKLSRSEERGFSAQERARASAERGQEHRDEAREYEQWQQRRSNKQRSGFN